MSACRILWVAPTGRKRVVTQFRDREHAVAGVGGAVREGYVFDGGWYLDGRDMPVEDYIRMAVEAGVVKR